jgi:hypothetical protein
LLFSIGKDRIKKFRINQQLKKKEISKLNKQNYQKKSWKNGTYQKSY